MKSLIIKVFFIIAAVTIVFPVALWSEDESPPASQPILVKAVMCEAIEKFSPVNESVVFSIDIGKLSCFTEFDPVPEQAVIYHKWYHQGALISSKQLTINPPRWSSFSSMQLRDTDKGPWQVDITDKDGKVFQSLRFSITD